VFGGHRSIAHAASVPPGCGTLIPTKKCLAGESTPTQAGTSVPAPTLSYPSPDTTSCGDDFFDSATQSALNANFGGINCFQFDGSSQWILIASGMELSGDGPTPGGAMIATETCSASSSPDCMDPNAAHDPGDFTVAYAPNPSASEVSELSSFDSNLLVINVPGCGATQFDADDGLWYPGTTSTSVALENATSPAGATSAALKQLDQLISDTSGSVSQAQTAIAKLTATIDQEPAGSASPVTTLLSQLTSDLPGSVNGATVTGLLDEIAQAMSAIPVTDSPLSTPPETSLSTVLSQPAPQATGSCAQ
jgi:hypothetical protein